MFPINLVNFAIFLDVESGTVNNLSIVRVFIFTLLKCILLKMSKQLCTSYLNGDGRHNTMKTEYNAKLYRIYTSVVH